MACQSEKSTVPSDSMCFGVTSRTAQQGKKARIVGCGPV